MTATLPSTMRALVTAGSGAVAVRNVPTPVLDPGEILVKVAAVAQNPTDWKYAGFQVAGRILGVDYAGTVVQVTEGVAGLNVGDRVAGFEHGGQYADRGSMAEYVKADAALVWAIPDRTSFEEAATMNCGLWTAIQALFGPGRLELPETAPSPAPWVLVYSGATSVGQYAIQLAQIAGYRVVTTASPRNFDLLRSLGADEAFDYNDADVAQRIRESTGGTLAAGLDTISEGHTQHAAISAYGKNGGTLVTILPPDKNARKLRADVQINGTILYTCLGRPFSFPGGKEYPASSADRAQMISWMPKITELAKAGELKPNSVKLWPGGLDAIKDGFEYMKAGKVRAEKIVYQL